MKDALIVQLLPHGTKAVEVISPIGDFKTAHIVDDNWEEVRERIFMACCMAGRRSVIFINGHCELYEKRLSTEPSRITQFGQHGLWVYMNRLLKRFGHVYVPPLFEWRDEPKHYYNCPTDGMVVGYQLAAIQKLDEWYGPLGQRLCAAGYDSFTIRDFFYRQLGPGQFPETGTHTSWSKAFIDSYKHILKGE
jgi:hypothetical protein